VLMGESGLYVYNALGISQSNSPDAQDFALLADYDGPTWLTDCVFYQIFPDRFANGDPRLDPPEGALSLNGYSSVMREWHEPPLPYPESGNLDFYGGDLPGIQESLDYLEDLGVNGIYLNPIFPAPSNHRYNAQEFLTVDPYLGGDESLVALRDSMRSRDMRLVLDLTTNHSGSTHQWFVAAQTDATSPSADFYTFNEHPHNYESWLGHSSLPKFNYSSPTLRDVMYRASTSIMQYWLAEPFSIDGWRLDVSNMTARQGKTQLAQEVWREMRRIVKARFPESYIFGEDFFDGTPNLQGDSLDATMNYQGFNMPTWWWLAGEKHPKLEVKVPPMPSKAYADQLDNFRAVLPWAIASQQYNQLSSHDTPRILQIVDGDVNLAKVAATLLMTYVGVPCVYYGDENGMGDEATPNHRHPMVWDDEAWNHDLHTHYKLLIHLRRTAPALLYGGYQRLYAEDDLFVFQRQSPEQRMIIIAYRGTGDSQSLTIPLWHGGVADDTSLVDLLDDDATPVIVRDGVITIPAITQPTTMILTEA